MSRYVKLFLSLALLIAATATGLFAAPPSKQASYLSVQVTGSDAATVKWRNGNGNGRVLVITQTQGSWDATESEINAIIDNDNNGTLDHTADGTWGAKQQIGATDEYVIAAFGDNTRTDNLSGLSSGDYYIKVFEFNVASGSAPEINMNGGTLNPRSFEIDLAAPTGIDMVGDDGTGDGTDNTGNEWVFTAGVKPEITWTDDADASGYYLDIYDDTQNKFVGSYDLLDIGDPSASYVIDDVFTEADFVDANIDKFRLRAYDQNQKPGPASDWKWFDVPADPANVTLTDFAAYIDYTDATPNKDLTAGTVFINDADADGDHKLVVEFTFSTEMNTSVAPVLYISADGTSTNNLVGDVFTNPIAVWSDDDNGTPGDTSDDIINAVCTLTYNIVDTDKEGTNYADLDFEISNKNNPGVSGTDVAADGDAAWLDAAYEGVQDLTDLGSLDMVAPTLVGFVNSVDPNVVGDTDMRAPVTDEEYGVGAAFDIFAVFDENISKSESGDNPVLKLNVHNGSTEEADATYAAAAAINIDYDGSTTATNAIEFNYTASTGDFTPTGEALIVEKIDLTANGTCTFVDDAGNIATWTEDGDGKVTSGTNLDANAATFGSPWTDTDIDPSNQYIDGKAPSVHAIAVTGISRDNNDWTTGLDFIAGTDDDLAAYDGVQNIGTSGTPEKVGLWSPGNNANGLFTGATGGAQAIKFTIYFDEEITIPNLATVTFKTNIGDIVYTNSTGGDVTGTSVSTIVEMTGAMSASNLEITNDALDGTEDISITGSIADGASNTLGTQFTNTLSLADIDTDNDGTGNYSQYISIETTAPELQYLFFLSARQPADQTNPYAVNEKIRLTAAFTEDVYYGANAVMSVNANVGASAAVDPVDADQATETMEINLLGTFYVLDFDYTVKAADATSQYNATSTTPFSCDQINTWGANYVYDAYGNRVDISSESVDLAPVNGQNLVVDGVAPTMSSVTGITTDGTYGEGNVIEVQVTFDEDINYTGGASTSTLAMYDGDGADGSSIATAADFKETSGTNALRYEYTVDGNDMTDDLGSKDITLNDDVITDLAGNPLTAFNPTTPLEDNAAIVLNTTAPEFTDNKVKQYLPLSGIWTAVGSGATQRAKEGDKLRFYSYFTSDITGFNELTITQDNPRLLLNPLADPADKLYASYNSEESNLNGTAPYYLVFEYTVLADDNLSMVNGTADAACDIVAIDGGTFVIKDNFGNPAASTGGSGALDEPETDVTEDDANTQSGYTKQELYIDGVVPTSTIAAVTTDDGTTSMNGLTLTQNGTHTAAKISVTYGEAMDTSIDPTITITDGTTTLVAGTDYTVTETDGGDFTNGWDVTTVDAPVYEITVDPADDLNYTDLHIEVSGGKDLAGNTQTAASSDGSINFDMDTELPADPVISVDVTDITLNDLDVVVTVSYSEAMTNDPDITLTNSTGDDVTDDFTTSDAGWTGNDFSVTYTFDNDPADQDGTFDFTVATTTVTDAAGNFCAAGDVSPTITVDADRPAINSITTDLTVTEGGKDWITDATVSGGTFTVTIEFDEEMDPASTPSLSFAPSVSTTITGINTSGWNNPTNTIYTVTYDLDDANTEALDIDYDVSGFEDVKGNTMTADVTTGENLFSIDTENPYITSASPLHLSVTTDNGNTIGNIAYAKVGDDIDVEATFNEAVTVTAATIAGTNVDVLPVGPSTAPSLTIANLAGTEDEGAVAFSIAAYTDARGNSGTAYSEADVENGTSGVLDFTAPTIDDVAYDASDDIIYNTGEPGTYQTKLTLSEAVYNTDAGSGALEAGDFSHTFTPDTPAELAGVNLGITQSDCSAALAGGESVICVTMTPTTDKYSTGAETITFQAVDGTSIYDIAGNAMAVAATAAVNFPSVPPFITDVNWAGDGPTGTDNTYIKDDVITVDVTFSQVVNVTDAPQLVIKDSDNLNTWTLDYSAGHGTNTLTFTYTVQDGDVACSLSKFDSFTIDGMDAIKNAGGTDATLTGTFTFAADPTMRSIDGDTPDPLVTVSPNDGSCLTAGDEITVTVVETENSCSGLSFNAATLSNTGNGTWSDWSEAPAGTWINIYKVGTTDVTAANPTLAFSIDDPAGNTYSHSAATSLSVDNTAPSTFVWGSVSNLDATAYPCVNAGTDVTAQFTFNESGCGNSAITAEVWLEDGSSNELGRTTIPVSNVGGNTYQLDTPFSYTVQAADNGVYELKALITDGVGNEYPVDGGRYVYMDNEAPTLTENAYKIDAAAVTGLGYTCIKDGVLTYQFTIGDALPAGANCNMYDITSSSVELLIGGSPVAAAEASGLNDTEMTNDGDQYTYTYDLSNLTNIDGETVAVRVNVEDALGNSHSYTTTETLTLDNVGPTTFAIDSYTPTQGTCITDGYMMTVVVDAANLGCGEFIGSSDIEVKLVNDVSGAETTAFGTFTFSGKSGTLYTFGYPLTDSDITDNGFNGAAYLRVRGTEETADGGTNVVTVYSAHLWDIDNEDPYEAVEFALSDECLKSTAGPVTLTGTVADDGCGLSTSNPQVSINGGSWTDVDNYSSTTGVISHEIDVTSLSGNCTVDIRYDDVKSNRATDQLTFVIDDVAPTISSMTADKTCYSNGETIQVTVSSSDPAPTCGSLTEEVTMDAGSGYTLTYDGSDSYDLTIDAVANTDLVGTHTITYTVTDGAGNVSTDTEEITINNPEGFVLADGTNIEIVSGDGTSGTYSTDPVCIKNGSQVTLKAEFKTFGCLNPTAADFTPSLTFGTGGGAVTITHTDVTDESLVGTTYTATLTINNDLSGRDGQTINARITSDDGTTVNNIDNDAALMNIDLTAPDLAARTCEFSNIDGSSAKVGTCFGTNEDEVFIKILPVETCSDLEDITVGVTFNCTTSSENLVEVKTEGTLDYYVYRATINDDSGDYTATVTVTDEAGNSDSEELTFDYDVDAPVITNVEVTGTPCSINAGNYQLTFDATDTGAGVCGTFDKDDITVSASNGTLITGIAYNSDDGTTYTYDFTVESGLGENITFEIDATDDKGNVATTGSTTAYVDNTNPVLTSATVTSETCLLDDTNVTFEVVASDNRDAQCQSTTVITVDGGVGELTHATGAGTVSDPFDFTLSTVGLSGTYNWTASIVDDAGNTTSDITGTFTVDDSDPVVSADVSADDCVKAGATLADITGTVTDEVSCTDIASGTLELEWWTTGGTLTHTSSHTAAASYTISETVPAAVDVPDGDYNLKVKYADELDRIHSVFVTDGVDNIVISVDNVAPTLSTLTWDTGDDCVESEEAGVEFDVAITSVDGCTPLTTGNFVVKKAFNSDASGGTTITHDGTDNIISYVEGSGTGTLTVITPALATTSVEDMYIYVELTDNSGNVTDFTFTNASTVDGELPAISTVTLSDECINRNSGSEQTVDITIAATDNGCGTLDFNIVGLGTMTVGAWTDNGDDTYTAALTIPSGVGGIQNLTAQVTDGAGNLGTTQPTFDLYIDNDAPVLSAGTNYALDGGAAACATEGQDITFNFDLSDNYFVAACGEVDETYITQVEISTDGGSTWSVITSDFVITETATDGTFLFTYTIPSSVNCNEGGGLEFRLTGEDNFAKTDVQTYQTGVTIDNTAPIFSIDIADDHDANTCSKTGDDITITPTQTVAGLSECALAYDWDNSTCTVTDANGVALTVSKVAGPAFEVTLDGSENYGTADVSVTLVDDKGNSSTQTGTFYIDNVLPSLSNLLVAPEGTESYATCYQGGTSVDIEFNSDDNTAFCGAAYGAGNIEVLIGTDAVGTATSLGSPEYVSGAATMTTTLPTHGTEEEWTVWVVATDNAGNERTITRSLFIDDKAPVLENVAVSTPAAGCVQDGTQLIVQFNASDAIDAGFCGNSFGAGNMSAEFDEAVTVSAVPQVRATATPGLYEVTVTPDNDFTGTSTLTITAWDKLTWNESTETIDVDFDNSHDVIPTVFVDGDVSCFAGGATFDIGIDITDTDATCSTNDWSLVSIEVDGPSGSGYYWSGDDTDDVDVNKTDTHIEWSYSLGGSPHVGTYTVTGTVKDGLGNLVTDTETFTVNNIAPTISNVDLDDDGTSRTCIRDAGTDAYQLTFDVSENGGCTLDPTLTTITISDGSTDATINHTHTGTGPYTFTSSAFKLSDFGGLTFADGDVVTFTVEVENEGSATDTETFTVTVDKSVPTISGLTVDACESDEIYIEFSSSDASGCGTYDENDIVVTVAGSDYTPVSAGGNDYTLTVSTTSIDEGAVTIAVNATDDAGNAATEATATTTVDKTPPAAVTLTLSETSEGDSETCFKNETMHINVTATDAGGCGSLDASNYDLVAYNSGGTPLGTQPTFTNVDANNWTMDISDLGVSVASDFIIGVTVTDDAGNAASEVQETFTVDVTPPSINDLVVADDCVADDDGVTVSVTVSDLGCNFNTGDASQMANAASRIDVYVTTGVPASGGAHTATAISNNLGGAIDHIVYDSYTYVGSGQVRFDFTWTVPTADDGDYYVSARFADYAGNLNDDFDTYATTTIDDTAPVATDDALVLSGATGGCTETGDKITVDFDELEITENGCGLAPYADFTVTAKNVSQNSGGTTEDVAFLWDAVNEEWYFEVLSIYDQQKVTVDVVFKDIAGNSTNPAKSFTDAFTIDNDAPAEVAITSALINAGNSIETEWYDVAHDDANHTIDIQVAIPDDFSLNGGTMATEVSADGSTWTTIDTSPIGAIDADKTVNISNSDLNTAGITDDIYSIRVALTDVCGNETKGTTFGSTLKVDRTKPTLSAVLLEGSVNANYAKAGEDVVLTFTASETLTDDPTVTLTAGGADDTGNKDGGVTAPDFKYTVAAADMAEGEVTFSIASFVDQAGNVGEAVTTGTGSVTVDKTNPSITPVTIASNNANDVTLAKVGDVITVTFTSDEELASGVTATIAGETASVTIDTDDTDGYVNTATATVTGTTTEGAAAFTITGLADLAGNTIGDVTAITEGSNVTVDRTAPDVDPVSIASNNAVTTLAKDGDIVTVSFTTDGTQASAPVVTIDGEDATEANPQNNKWTADWTVHDAIVTSGANATFEITATDAAGNTATVTVVTDGSAVTYDTDAPADPTFAISVTGGTQVSGYLNSTNTAATVDYTVPNDATLEDGTVQFGYYNGGWNNLGAAYTILNGDLGSTLNLDRFANLDGLGDGTYNTYLKVTDKAGNETITGTSVDLTVDQTVPAVTYTVTSGGNDRTAGGKWVAYDDVVTVTLGGDNADLDSWTAEAEDGDMDLDMTENGTATATFTFATGTDYSALTGLPAITLTGNDAAGNPATFAYPFDEATDNTAHYDFVAPVITLTDDTFSDGTSGDRTPVSDDSEFAFTTDEADNEAVVTLDGGSTSAAITEAADIKMSDIAAFAGVGDGADFSLLISDTDEAGNEGSAQYQYLVKDETEPTIESLTINSDNSVLTVTFSEEVYNSSDAALAIGDLSLGYSANGSALSVTDRTITHPVGGDYSIAEVNVSYSGTATGAEQHYITGGTAYDEADNLVQGTLKFVYCNAMATPAVVDAITAAEDCYAIGDDVVITVSWDENLTGAPTSASLTLSNGETASYTSYTNDNVTYTYTVESDDTDADDLTVTAINGTYTTASGTADNGLQGNQLANVQVDANAPALTVTTPDIAENVCASTLLDVTFDGTLTAYWNGGAATAVADGDALNTINGWTEGDTDLTLTATDACGNTTTVVRTVNAVDLTEPQVVAALDVDVASDQVTITFNENMSGLAGGTYDVVIDGVNSTTETVASSTATTVTLNVDDLSGLGAGDVVTATVSGVTDEHCNSIDAANDEATYTHETQPEIVSAAWTGGPAGCYKAADADLTFEVTFDQDVVVTGIPTATVTNGTATFVSEAGGVLTFTVDIDGDGAVALTAIAAGTSIRNLPDSYDADLTLNGNTVSGITADNTLPTVDEALANTSNTEVTVTLSDANILSGLTTLTNYTLSSTDGTWTNGTNPTGVSVTGNDVTLTVPDYSGLGGGETITVTVAGVTDCAGNAVDAANDEASYINPATAPDIASVEWINSPGACVNDADAIEFTVTFDSDVVVTGTPTVVMANATATYDTEQSAGVLRFDVTPNGDGLVTLTSITGTIKDASNTVDADLTLTGVTNLSGVTADNTDPVVTAIAPASGCYVDGTGTITSVSVTDAGSTTVTAQFAGGGTWTTIVEGTTTLADISGYTANSALALTLKAVDCAGNTSANYGAGTYTFDNVDPTVSTTLGTPTNTTVTVTFTDVNLDQTSAETTGNYSLSTDDTGLTWTGNPSGASLSGNTVTLTVPNYGTLAGGKTLTVTVTGVTDCASNQVTTTNAEYTKPASVQLTVAQDGTDNLYANTSNTGTFTVSIPSNASSDMLVTLTEDSHTIGSGTISSGTSSTNIDVTFDDDASGYEGIDNATVTASATGALDGTTNVDVLPKKPTGTPANIAVIGGSGMFTITWDETGTAEGSVVVYTQGGTPANVVDGTANTVQAHTNGERFEITGLLKRVAYGIKVFEYNINGGTLYSNTESLVSFGNAFVDGTYYTTRKDVSDGTNSGLYGMQVSSVYPNPATTEFAVDLTLAEAMTLTVKVIDEEGRTVAVPVEGVAYNAGENTIKVELEDTVSSGSYFITITADDEAVVHPITIVK